MSNITNFETTVEPSGRLFIVELSPPFERLEFQSVPDKLTDAREGAYAQIDVPGRNNPLHQYTGGTDNINFVLQFFADEDTAANVIAKCRWLKSLIANDGYEAGARRVKIIWGDLFKNETWFLRSCSIEYQDFHSKRSYNPVFATANLSFSLDTDKNRTLQDMRL